MLNVVRVATMTCIMKRKKRRKKKKPDIRNATMNGTMENAPNVARNANTTLISTENVICVIINVTTKTGIRVSVHYAGTNVNTTGMLIMALAISVSMNVNTNLTTMDIVIVVDLNVIIDGILLGSVSTASGYVDIAVFA